MTSNCKSCGAAILWATTAKGKSMPLDAQGETLWLIEQGPTGTAPTTRPVQVRKSHFSSCPQADQHRKAAG